MAYYKKDQLSIKTRKLFADYLADLILITDSIQSFRIALAETQFFNGVELFRCLDKDQKGYLTPQDFTLLVSDQTKKVFHYAFSWFDVSKVGEITRAEFLQFLFPQTNQQLRNLVSERMLQECTPEQRKITLPIQQDLLRELLLQIMQKQTRLIPIRRNFMDQDDYTLKAAMNCLDVQGRGWITTGDIYKFLRNFDIDVEANKVCSMLGVFDNDLNGKISMNQLEWLIQGLENSNSSYRKIVRQSNHKAIEKLKNQRCSCYKQKIHRSTEKAKVIQIQQQSKAQTAKKKLKKINDYSDKKNSNIKQQENVKKPILKEFSDTTIEIKKKKQKKKKNQKSISSKFQYLELKNAFLALEKQTQQIDEDLRKIEQQMGTRTQIEFEQELQNAHIKRKLKKQQEQRIKIRMQQLQMLQLQREKSILNKIKQQQTIRLMQQQNRRLLEQEKVKALEQENEYFRQIQQKRLREAELENIRIRGMEEAIVREKQNQKLIDFQQKRLSSIRKMTEIKLAQQENRRSAQMEQQRLEQLQKIKQMQLNHLLSKKKMEDKIYDRQIQAGLEKNIKLAKSELDWESETKLRLLHEEQLRRSLVRGSVTQKENQYFWRYSNYCQNLANVVDPLGIKEHLAQTDKYLMKSKELRDEIKRDRTYSLNKYSNQKAFNKNRFKMETEKDEIGVKTPEQRRDIIQTINKRTQQTKLAWSQS